MNPSVITVPARSRRLSAENGQRTWQVDETPVDLDPARCAVLLCDVWDAHWCRGAEQRLEPMLPAMNALVGTLRDRGFLVVHAPSETMAHYEGSPARKRALAVARTALPPATTSDPPELPIGISDSRGCDMVGDAPQAPWTRQHPAIDIDEDRDVVSDSGEELYSVYRARDISTVLILGVHTNMCVLNRSFAIKAMVGWGFRPILVRDLTDAMYDPADPPYVSHEEGTGLVIEYVEKFWCPSVTSRALS